METSQAWVFQTWKSTGTRYVPVSGTRTALITYDLNHTYFYLVVSSQLVQQKRRRSGKITKIIWLLYCILILILSLAFDENSSGVV